ASALCGPPPVRRSSDLAYGDRDSNEEALEVRLLPLRGAARARDAPLRADVRAARLWGHRRIRATGHEDAERRQLRWRTGQRRGQQLGGRDRRSRPGRRLPLGRWQRWLLRRRLPRRPGDPRPPRGRLSLPRETVAATQLARPVAPLRRKDRR